MEEYEDLLTMSESCGDELSNLKMELDDCKLWNQSLSAENKSFRMLFEYLARDIVGEHMFIIEAIDNVRHFSCLGYIEVTKRIGNDQEVLLDFEVPESEEIKKMKVKPPKEKHTAEWTACNNYGVWQTRNFEDDWQGYMLFPTHKDNRYLLVWFAD